MKKRSFTARHGAAIAAACTALVLSLVLMAYVPSPASRDGPPPPGRWFDDRAGMVSPSFASAKSTYLQSYLSQALHYAVLVVIEPSTPGDIQQYATAAAASWKFGSQGADNGVVFFVFPSVRTARLEVGYGVEGAIPDIEAKHLVETTLVPPFSAGRYEDGFEDFLAALVARLKAHEGEAAKADKPMGIVAFAMGILRQVPRMSVEAREMFRSAEPGGRVIMTIAGVLLAAGLGYGLTGVALGAWALVQLPWRVAHAGDLHLEDVVQGVMALGGMIVAVAFLGLGSQALMEGHGGFSGAGAAVVWPEPR